MIHDDFINYRLTELTAKLNDIKNVKQQYLAQLMLLKETLNDCKEIVHQKYNLTDLSVKEFFDVKGTFHK
jgi:hypothetical protein